MLELIHLLLSLTLPPKVILLSVVTLLLSLQLPFNAHT